MTVLRPLAAFLLLLLLAPSGLSAQTLYGYRGGGETPLSLYTIDPTIPTATLVGSDGTGAIAEIELADGVVYGAETVTNTNLRRIDPATGLILSTLTMTFPPQGDVITAMEYVGSTMYAILTTEEGGESYLCTIDLTTGIVTLIGDTGFAFPMGGLAYDTNTGILYAVSAGGAPGELFTVSLATGVATSVGLITTAAGPLGTTALEFGPDGVLYLLPNPRSGVGGHLFSIDPATAFATEVGDLGVPTAMTALTSEAPLVSVVEIPTLSPWGLAALIGALAGLALLGVRRRRPHEAPPTITFW